MLPYVLQRIFVLGEKYCCSLGALGYTCSSAPWRYPGAVVSMVEDLRELKSTRYVDDKSVSMLGNYSLPDR